MNSIIIKIKSKRQACWRLSSTGVLKIFCGLFFCKFVSRSFIFYLLTFMCSLCSLDTNLLSDIWCTNMFFQAVVCLFIPSTITSMAQSFLFLMKFNLSIFIFMDYVSLLYLRTCEQTQSHATFLLLPLSKWIALHFIFSSRILFV